MTTTLASIADRAERARAALIAAQGRLANEAFPSYEGLTRVVDCTATTKVWETLAYLADVRRTQGEHVHDTDEQVIGFLKERIVERVFGHFGNHSTNQQSNLGDEREHLAWIEAGREAFGIGRGW